MMFAWDEFEERERVLLRDECAKAARDEANFTDLEGAKRLKAKIEAHWRERGFKPPEIELIAQGFDNSVRACRYDVRSDMRGGMPLARADAEVAQ
jgi:hypothetical protein